MMIIPQSPVQSASASYNYNTPKVDTAVIQQPKHPMIRAVKRGGQRIRTRIKIETVKRGGQRIRTRIKIENKFEEYKKENRIRFYLSAIAFIGGTVLILANHSPEATSVSQFLYFLAIVGFFDALGEQKILDEYDKYREVLQNDAKRDIEQRRQDEKPCLQLA